MLNTRQSGIDPLECSPSNKMETPESCPAVLLPYEILGVIFSYNLPSVHKLHSVEDFDGEFEALRLSHVYRRWRLVCHEMPHLWQTIAILDIEEEEAKDATRIYSPLLASVPSLTHFTFEEHQPGADFLDSELQREWLPYPLAINYRVPPPLSNQFFDVLAITDPKRYPNTKIDTFRVHLPLDWEDEDWDFEVGWTADHFGDETSFCIDSLMFLVLPRLTHLTLVFRNSPIAHSAVVKFFYGGDDLLDEDTRLALGALEDSEGLELDVRAKM
ncbi:hypothetical protein D9757_010404 [Collybiopsis confluens]|uniref:F-box domain-containing protein n=1 Tax=Collybiopsis confluens TaxID=2823264 RepID=A0A8H5GPR9_9AGAR|nr:hypothetical protein D9757_010404 [Collybiopsis confluens]